MKHIVCVFAIFSLFLTQTALGIDQQVTSTLSAEGYSIYSPGRDPLSRRRFVEDLQVGVWNMLPGEDDPYYEGPRLSIDMALRLSADASIKKSEVDSHNETGYVPGITPVSVHAMVAYVDAVGFWDDTMDVRAGRQIRLDTLGFFAFDGLDTRMRLPIGLDLTTYVGMEVRGGQMLGYDALELDGTDRGGRKDLPDDQYPDREESNSRLAIGTELVLHPSRYFELAGAFRAVGLNSGTDQLADERFGARALIDVGPVEARGRLIFSPLTGSFSEQDVELGVTPHQLISFFIDYHYYEPVFEGDSIFNVFDLSPQNDLGGRIELRLSRKLELAAWGFARMATETAQTEDEQDGTEAETDKKAVFAGTGAGFGGNYRTPQRRLSVRVSGVQEWGESKLGAELGGGHALLRNRRWWIGARVSFWHIQDRFSKMYRGFTAGYVLSTRFRLSHRAYMLGEFEHYLGEGRNKRFVALALLQLDLWR